MDSAKQISQIMRKLREHETRLSVLEGSIIDTASHRGTTNESGAGIEIDLGSGLQTCIY
jgi:hypothetical protein